MKRSNASGSNGNDSNEHLYEDEEIRMVQEVLGKMIFQAGVDFEYVAISLAVQISSS